MKLKGENLVKIYGNREVVQSVSIEVNQGEIVGLLGPNGAGKTTTFYMMVGFIQPNGGHVYLDDEDITGLAMYRRAQKGLGYLPQEPSVFRKLSVEDNISAILEMTKLSKSEQRDKLESLIDEFGLHKVRTNLGDSLSGGERRRTEIARSLASSPKFILLDEPFAGIDPIAVEDIQSIVQKLKDKNIGILITDHNVQETLSITERAYLMFEGNILKTGTAEELAADEMVRKVYLGQNFELRKKVQGAPNSNEKKTDKDSMNFQPPKLDREEASTKKVQGAPNSNEKKTDKDSMNFQSSKLDREEASTKKVQGAPNSNEKKTDKDSMNFQPPKLDREEANTKKVQEKKEMSKTEHHEGSQNIEDQRMDLNLKKDGKGE